MRTDEANWLDASISPINHHENIDPVRVWQKSGFYTASLGHQAFRKIGEMKNSEVEIISLSKQIVEIELRKDAAALETLICDDYVGIDPSGILIDKEVSVGRYRRSDFELSKLSLSDISVSILEETAIEIGIMNLEGKIGSFEFGGRYRYSHIWKRTATGWKVRASQLTPILRDVA